METIIKEMIQLAEDEHNLDLASSIHDILSCFASTINCPSNWRYLGSELAKEYSEDSWEYECVELWDFMD